MASRCAAVDCGKGIKSDYLMCAPHWRMVPLPLQNEIWKHFDNGQTAATASDEYMQAYKRAVNAVAAKEHKPLQFPGQEFAP